MKISETVKATLSALPPEFIDWLNSLRNRNPLDGSDSGKNSNLVFVSIGRNIVVDAILDARNEALHPQPVKMGNPDGSEIMSQEIVAN